MANTFVTSGNTVNITGLDTDVTPATIPVSVRGKHLASIQYVSSGADVFILRNGSITGAIVFHCKCAADTTFSVKYFPRGSKVTPAIDVSECTFAVVANAKVILQFH